MRRAALLSEQANVWTYPGAFSLGSNARRGLKDHPTAKPSAMPEDALLDVTHRGDIVVDPFLGSGSTLIGAEKTGRVCAGVDLDALYAEVIVRRYEAATDNSAVLRDRRDLRGAGPRACEGSTAGLGPDPEAHARAILSLGSDGAVTGGCTHSAGQRFESPQLHQNTI